ncbi:MAG: hypothetical protein V4678_04080 [Patescibacteria group bacterium]
MDETFDTTQLSQSPLQTLLGNSETSLIPESLVTTMIVSFVVLNILGVLFLIFYVMGMVRKWKVQSAVLTMQKDLAEIKTTLTKQTQPLETSTSSTTAPSIVQPTQSSRTIASTPPASESVANEQSRLS